MDILNLALNRIYQHIKIDPKAADHYSPLMVKLAMRSGIFYESIKELPAEPSRANKSLKAVYEHINDEPAAACYYEQETVKMAMRWRNLYDKPEEPTTSNRVAPDPSREDQYIKGIYEHIKDESDVVFYYEPETVRIAPRWGALYDKEAERPACSNEAATDSYPPYPRPH